MYFNLRLSMLESSLSLGYIPILEPNYIIKSQNYFSNALSVAFIFRIIIADDFLHRLQEGALWEKM